MRAIARIPKTLSKPVDPSKLAFLDVLPELRNAIYQELFGRKEPVLLHNSQAYHIVHPSRSDANSYDDLIESLENYDNCFEYESARDHDFKHDFHTSLSLLLSCRQIYHEAVGVFYGCNSFLLTRYLDRCDGPSSANHYYADTDYCQIPFAGKWLHGLGAQYEFLTQVSIDVDTLCPSDCSLSLEELDLLPLLYQVWRYPASQCSITFVRTGRVLQGHERDSRAEEKNTTFTSKINNIFRALAYDDTLQLKRFAFTDRILKEVSVSYMLPEILDFGYAVYQNYDAEDSFARMDDVSRRFGISDDGLSLEWDNFKEPVRLLTLPRAIRKKIFSYAARNPATAIVLDLDRRTAKGIPTSLLQVNREMQAYETMGSHIAQDTPVTLVATSSEACTDFPVLENLRFVRLSCFNNALVRPESQDDAHHLTIVLNIKPTLPVLMAHVRIDIKRLLPLVTDFVSRKTIVRIHLTFPTDHGNYEESAEIQLGRLRRQLFLLLSYVMTSRGVNNLTWTHDSRTLPTILINGRCKVLSASYSGTPETSAVEIVNQDHDLRSNEIMHKGYMFSRLYNDNFADHDFPSDSLYHVWRELLRLEWSNWREKRPRR